MTALPKFDIDQAGHTAGPWAVHPMLARVECAQPSEKGGLLPVCQLLWPTDERSEAETEANARLIAAAPDLLGAADEAAKELAFLLGPVARGDIPLRNLLAAIAKARGGEA